MVYLWKSLLQLANRNPYVFLGNFWNPVLQMNKELSNAEFILNLGNLEGHSRLPVSCA